MYKTLSYASCNMSTIILFSVISTLMVITIIIMKLFIDGEIFNDAHGCLPISFYFGQSNGCKRLIYNTIDQDGFQTITPQVDKNDNIIFDISYFIFNFFRKNIINIFNEIILFGKFIVETNDILKSVIYKFGKEKVSFIYI